MVWASHVVVQKVWGLAKRTELPVFHPGLYSVPDYWPRSDTDIYGRLMFPCEKEREVLIKASKNGYETVETKSVIKAGTVIYFKMGSGSYYASKAEKLLDERDAISASKMIDKALEIEERKDWRYLQEIIYKESNK